MNRGLAGADDLDDAGVGAHQFVGIIKAGMLAIRAVGEPGTQGVGRTGVQGMGGNTPNAAVVADAAVGFASEEQTPKGRMFTKGTLSMMLAIGMLVVTRFFGKTIREEGAAPKEHCGDAPPHTVKPIDNTLIYCRNVRVAF